MKLRHQLLIARKYEKPAIIRGIHTNPAWRQDNSRSLWEVVQSSPEADAELGVAVEPDWILVTPPNTGVFWDYAEVPDESLPLTVEGEARTKRVEHFLVHAGFVIRIIPWTTKEITDMVLGTRILVKPDEAVEKTAAGLLLPQIAEKRPTTGTIVEVGPDVEGDLLTPDTRILYSLYAGTDLEMNGTRHVILEANQAMMTIEPGVEVGTP